MQKKIISYVLIKNGPIEDHYQDVELSDGVFFRWHHENGWCFFDNTPCRSNFSYQVQYNNVSPHIIEFLLITKGNDLFCEFLPGPKRFLKFQPGKDVIFDQLTPYAGETFTGPTNCLPQKCSVQ